MRFFTRSLPWSPGSRPLKNAPILALLLSLALLTIIPKTTIAQTGPCDFQVRLISSTYAGGSTTFILEIKQGVIQKQPAISHMTFKMPESPCAPPYIGTSVGDWAEAYFSSSPTGPWGSEKKITYGVDPSGCSTGNVFKIDDGTDDETFYLKLVLAGKYTGAFPDIQMKYGQNCCSVPVSSNNTGTWCWNVDCVLDLRVTADPILCFGGTTSIVATPIGNGSLITSYTLTPGNIVSANGVFNNIGAGLYTVTITEDGCTAQASINLTEPTDITASAVPTNPNCFGGLGSIALTVSGGTPGYTFLWNDGNTDEDRTGLTAGTYSVTITDSQGCTETAEATIEVPSDITASAVPTNPNCFGGLGSIALTVSGGTPGYTFLWNDGNTDEDRTGLTAGTYSVTITDSQGCTETAEATIEVPGDITASAVPTNPNCFGGLGSIALTVSGGTPGYTFLWNDGNTDEDRTGLTAGTYSVTITDSQGCTETAEATIEVPGDITASAVPTNPNCFGGLGSIALTVSGGTPGYTFLWNDGNTDEDRTGLTAGTYSVTITDSQGCTETAEATVEVPSDITASAVPTNPNCFGGLGSIALTVSGGTPGYTFLWNDGNTDEDRTGLTAGTYSVTITDSQGCTETAEATIEVPSDITASAVPTNPNCFGGLGSIALTVSGGTPGYTFLWNDGNTDEDRTGLTAGTYSVTITDSQGCTETAEATIEVPGDITASAVPTNPNCFGGLGSIALTVSGGTPGYTFLWNDGNTDEDRTGLTAGTYSVTITDSQGCTETAEATIEVPGDITASAVPTNPNCFGGLGSIALTVSGGTPGYTFLWNDGNTDEDRTGLTAGTYSVTITDSQGCTETAEATIEVPTDIKVIATVANPTICEGSTTAVTVTAYGGTGILQYSLDNSTFNAFTSMDAGIYTVSFNIGASTTIYVKDENDCAKPLQITITVNKCENFCTYTQGYFGNDEGLSTTPNGGGNANYLVNGTCEQSRVNATIAHALNSGSMPTMLGNIPIGTLTPDQIISYLPGGGPSAQYTGTTLPAKNTLVAQLLTLALNMGLNADLELFTLPSSGIIYTQKAGDCGNGTATGSCSAYSFNDIGKGKTVGELYALASAALVSGTNSERSAYANVADAINRAFDECAKICIPQTTIDPSNLLTFTSNQRPSTVATERKLKVKAYPNPFTDRIFINFTSPVTGKAVVEIFDMSGRRLAEINKGNVNAFAEHKVEYMVPTSSRSAIIYKVTVGSYSITGRMIAPTR